MPENLNFLSFTDLVNLWHNETRFCSDTSKIVSHRAYLRIIAMSCKALPHIFKELERAPDHWHQALFAITGENPVPEEHRDSLTQTRQDWLAWAKEHLELPKGRAPGSWCCQRCGCADVKFRVPASLIGKIGHDARQGVVNSWHYESDGGVTIDAKLVYDDRAVDFVINGGDD